MQLTKKCPKYTYRKDGVYYFSKAVPKDLLDLYRKPRIVKCLGTRSPQSAQFVAKAMLAKLEDYWLGVRLKRMEVPAAELLVHARSAYSSELPLMSDALDAYVQIKGPDKSKLFAPHAKRNVTQLVLVAVLNPQMNAGASFPSTLVREEPTSVPAAMFIVICSVVSILSPLIALVPCQTTSLNAPSYVTLQLVTL